ncbi:hypothetical protein Tco_1124979 [Tanacetum coccineum]|uniref:Uncharacterized protein n=1 Tax=Tanacetum coccineum TaxID=301880 RepID=A0ABQ5JBR0_9ASTR
MAGTSGSNSVIDDLIELNRRGFIARMGPEVNIARNELGQLNALIAGLEASEDVGEVWDTIIRGDCGEAEGVEVKEEDGLSIMDTQAIDDQAHLANYDSDNEIENDDLGYHSEEYFDDAHEDYENNHSNGNVVKRGITRLKKKEIDQDEEPTRGTLWLKGRVNKDGEYQDDEIRSVGDKLVSLVDIHPVNSSADEEGENNCS